MGRRKFTNLYLGNLSVVLSISRLLVVSCNPCHPLHFLIENFQLLKFRLSELIFHEVEKTEYRNFYSLCNTEPAHDSRISHQHLPFPYPHKTFK